jgi:hypothetical protein
METSAKEITCLDESPVAQQAARQEFLNRYYRAVVLIPAFVATVIGVKFFGENSSVTVYLILASLIFGLSALGYHLFLIITLRCPVCGWRYGRGSKCSSCGLPRHRPSSAVQDIVDWKL